MVLVMRATLSSRAEFAIQVQASEMRRFLRTAVGSLVVCLVAYVALLCHPQPLFAYSQSRGNLTLHSRAPLPANTATVLDDALARIRRSPLYDQQLQHHVFLCPSSALFDFFVLWQYRARGVTMDYLNGNIFIGPASVERNEVYGPSGRAAGADRPLSYYLAHEVTHHMTSAKLGRVGYFRLRPWQREGYADYVGRTPLASLADEAARLRDGARELDPKGSGLYLRYRLEVAFLLDEEHLSVEQLFASTRPETELAAAVLAAYSSSK
jgi:hypothetical protein